MDIYKNSTLYEKVTQHKKIALLDIDLTLTGKPEIQQQVRTILRERGYAVGFITSRCYELILSDAALNNSPTLTRLPSKIAKDAEDKYFHVDLASIPAFQGIIDPDVIASTTGIDILLRQTNGTYVRDSSLYQFDFSSEEWKKELFNVLKTLKESSHCHFEIKACEYIFNYQTNVVDISPPDYRMQLDFKSLEEQNHCIEALAKAVKNVPIHVLDDSEPEWNRYSIYLFPVPADRIKEIAATHIVQQISKVSHIPTHELQVFIAGDSYPDLNMILHSAPTKRGLYYLAGGSRLYSYFTDREIQKYLHIDISHWKKIFKKIDEGIYSYNERTIYVGDELFPQKKHAESILAFLQSAYAHIL